MKRLKKPDKVNLLSTPLVALAINVLYDLISAANVGYIWTISDKKSFTNLLQLSPPNRVSITNSHRRKINLTICCHPYRSYRTPLKVRLEGQLQLIFDWLTDWLTHNNLPSTRDPRGNHRTDPNKSPKSLCSSDIGQSMRWGIIQETCDPTTRAHVAQSVRRMFRMIMSASKLPHS